MNTLKRIAEELGYEAYIVDDIVNIRTYINNRQDLISIQKFDPLNNPAQLYEIQEHWKISTSFDDMSERWAAYHDGEVVFRIECGKTISEAVMNCMNKIIGGEL